MASMRKDYDRSVEELVGSKKTKSRWQRLLAGLRPRTWREKHESTLQLESLERRDLFSMTTTPDEVFDTAATPVGVQLGYFDDDSRVDMAVLQDDGMLSVALNNGDDTWRQVKTTDLGVDNPVGMTFGLFNDDEFLDVVVQGEDELVLAYGDGTGAFTIGQTLTPEAAGDLAPTAGTVTLAAGMFDGDAFTDLAVVVPGTNEVLIYRGQANGTLGGLVQLSSGGTEPVHVVSGNFIGDGLPDLAVAHTDGTLSFFGGQTDGSFVLQPTLEVTGLGSVVALAAADLDEDGDTDLVATSATSVKVLFNPSDPVPTSPISNGDFSLGLTGWQATAGSVSAGSGVVQIRENSTQLLSTLEQEISIPTGAATISFDLSSLGLEAPIGGLADAFEVSLLDENGESLVATFDPDATSFYNVAADGTVSAATGVSISGTTVTLDVSAITGGTTARLIFDLIGNPGGLGSSVILDNVSIVPATVWGDAYSATTLSGSLSGVGGMVIADVDGDDHLDIVLGDAAAGKIVVYNGNGTGSFTYSDTTVTSYGTSPTAVAAAPLDDGDDIADVVVTLVGSDKVLSPIEYIPVVEDNIFRVPGAPGELTELVFTWTVRDAGYNNELGFYIVDDVDGSVNGLEPGDTGYIEAALQQPGRQVVFAASQTQGAITRVVLPAGTLITPYLVQNNSTGNQIRNNPSGSVSGSPLVWFLHGDSNTDGYTHFHVDILPDGTIQYSVEDQTHSGDGDFNDMIFTLKAEPGEPLPMTRFVTVDDTSLANFRYDVNGVAAEQTGLEDGNTNPRGITATAAGDKYWVIDSNKKVYVYDNDGSLLGSWTTAGLNTPTDITTDGTDIWIVDKGNDRVYRFTGAASRTSGSQAAASNFQLNSGNGNASGITTDGSFFWVVDETADKVFVYSMQGALQGSWTIDSANADASGITINPSGGDDIWIVDRQDAKVYRYEGGKALLSGTHSATDSFNLAAANRKPEGIADPPTAIDYNTTVTASISVSNEVDEYTFTAAAGQLVYFKPVTPGFSTNLKFKIVGPSGTVQNYANFAHATSISLPDDGSYTLSITATSTVATYEFQLVSVPPTTIIPIEFGTAYAGSITASGEIHKLTFDAESGDTISFATSFVATSWIMYAPNGTWSVVGNGIVKDLTQTGEYTVVIAGTNGATPSWTATVHRLPPPVDVPVSVGDVISSNISVAGEIDRYVFIATEGQQVLFDAISTVVGQQTWQLYNPTGGVVFNYTWADRGPYTLVSGEYILVIDGVNANTPSYSFQIVDVDPAVLTQIELNEVVEGEIESAGQVQQYRFSASAGQNVYLHKIAGHPTDLNVKLEGPPGTVWSEFTFADRDTTELLSDGEYTLSVWGDGAFTGAYEFCLFAVPTQAIQSIAVGQVVAGATTVPGEEHRYTFTGSTGDRLFFDVMQAGVAIDAIAFKILDSGGTSIFTPAKSSEDRTLFTLPDDDTYTIVVGDGANLDSTGDYRFQLVSVPADFILPVDVNANYSDLVVAGQTIEYEFEGTAGQGILFDVLTNTRNVPFVLIGPSAQTIFSSRTSDYWITSLPETGTYTLIAGGDENDDAGPFSFRLQDTTAPTVGTPDTKGTEFWVAFPSVGRDVYSGAQNAELSLYLTAEVDTSGTISIPGLEWYTSFTIRAGETTRIVLPTNAEVALTGAEVTTDKGVHITALDEISVYGTSYIPALSDGFLAIPVDALGTEYLALTYQNTGVGLSQYMNSSHFTVVATEDDTEVTITPSVTTGSRTAGVPYIVNLDAGEVYQLTNQNYPDDLTGTIISADKKISVLTGNGAATVPHNTPTSDHLLEQIAPTSTWGETYLTVPFATRTGGDRFRILAAEDDTDVSIDGSFVATLDRGDFYEVVLTDASLITADKPIQVAQFAHSTNFDFVANADPMLVLLAPVEQFQEQYVVTTPTVGYSAHYLNLIVPASEVGELTLDGVAIPALVFTAIGSTGFYSAQVQVSPGRHELRGAKPFGLSMYGYGVQDAYGYSGGSSLAAIDTVSTVDLTPSSTTLGLGSQHIFTATVTDGSNPLVGVRVDFYVNSSTTPNGFGWTDASGDAQFIYKGTAIGTDTIAAKVGDHTDTATVTWSTALPVIFVDSPLDDSDQIAGSTILLSGRALPGTPLGSIVDVTVNGLSVESLDAAGRFFIRVPIASGTNNFTIEATAADGSTGTTGVSYNGVAAPGSGVDYDDWNDLAGVMSLTSNRTFFNRETNTLHARVNVTNDGNDPFVGTIAALFNRITPASVTHGATPDGTAPDGRAQIIFDTEMPIEGLASGEGSDGVWITFEDPARLRFSIDVTFLAAGNVAPVFDSVPRTEATVGVEYSHQIVASDANGDERSYELILAPEGMEIDAAGLITWTPTAPQEGLHEVEVQVSDGRGGTTTQRFSVIARDNPVNRPPVFTSAPVVEVATSASYTYQAAALDLDGDTLTWYLDQKPGTMSINSGTGEVTWSSATSGNHTVKIRVEDGAGGVAYQTYVLYVGSSAANEGAPRILNAPPTEATEDVLYAWQVWAEDPDGGSLTYSLIQKPTNMAIDSNGRITWTPGSSDAGAHTIEVKVDDGAGGIATLVYSLNVTTSLNNRLPVFTTQPGLIATENALYQYTVAAQDPDGHSITLELADGPEGMTFNATTGVLRWTPATEDLGVHVVRLRAYDSLGGSSWQTYLIDVRPVNGNPWFETDPITTATVDLPYRYDVDANDNDDAITYSLIAPPTNMTIDPRTGLIWWVPDSGDLGPNTITVRATDERGGIREQIYTLTVTEDEEDPSVTLVLSEEVVDINDLVTAKIYANDNVSIDTIALEINGSPATLNGQNEASFTPLAAGFYTFTATVEDDAGNITVVTKRLKVIDPTDVTAPVITVTSPDANDLVTYLVDIEGSITDANLDSYRIEYARFDTNEFRLLAEGTSAIVSDVLATFDPTMLQNDQYIVRIIATDLGGNTSTYELPLEVTGNLKLGQFRMDFTDLTIPLAGIPITITRTYDSLQANELGDFGYGWSLGVKSANIRETVRQNPLESTLGIFATNAFREGTRVYITAPDGRRIGFTFTPTVETGLLGDIYRPKFTADPGVYETLSVEDMALSKAPDGTYHLYWSSLNYNPRAYTLTTKDGVAYDYDQFDQLQMITDRNGNTLTFTDEGIVSSTGQSIEFVRDDLGRITQIIDPAENAITYTYDGNGDLVGVTNQENQTTTFTYLQTPSHYLHEMFEPGCGCFSHIRLEYDENGRLIGNTDAEGNTISASYDLGEMTETIADQIGNESTLEYDDRGNIVAVIDPMGARVEYAYDANDNVTSITDARGNITTYAYDARGNVTTITTADEGVWNYAYDSHNMLLSVADALGRLTEFEYDAEGNLTKTTDALGEEIIMAYDAAGRITSVTDRRGNETTMEYAIAYLSQPTKITNADDTFMAIAYSDLGLPTVLTDENGNETTVVYDFVGRMLSVQDANDESTTFTWDNNRITALTDRRGNTTRYAYNENGQMSSMTDALGNTTTYEYNANKQLTKQIDAIGRVTSYAYRADGRVESMTYADTDETSTTQYEYDAAGNLTAVIDANGHRTTYSYDEVNRVASMVDALGGVETYAYDLVGNLVSWVDPRGNAWTYAYSDLNQLLSVTDPLAGESVRTYDENGNLLTYTDPNLHVTTYEYDDRNRLVELIDADSNSWLYGYDDVGNLTSFTDANSHTTTYVYDALNQLYQRTNAMSDVATWNYDEEGNLVSFIDEALRETTYQYDAANRLVGITDAMSGQQTFAYDGVGHLTGYTDQLDRTTSYSYNLFGQLASVTNALGGVEFFAYDAVGNQLSYSDALGRTTQFEYDALNRLVREVDPLGYDVEYAFDAASNLVSFTDELDKVTTFVYDAMNRQTKMIDPLGGEVEYGYDAASNLTSVTDEINRVTEYEYDVLDRMTKIIDASLAETEMAYDPVGNLVSFIDPLNQETTYEYDELNRLIERTDPLLHSTTFDYDEVGNVTSIIDRNGRERTFEYDDLDRLTDETWWTSAVAVNHLEFDYDAVGNLISATDAYSAYTFTYNDLDWLTSEDNDNTPNAPHVILTYTYDAVGNPLTASDDTGVTVESRYNARDELMTRAWYGGAVDDARIDFTYNARGEVTEIERFSDLDAGTQIGRTEFGYDDFGHVTSITHRDAIDAILADYDYTWDLAHQLTSESHHGNTTTYAHDDLGQLEEADHTALTDEAYNYDDNGNRTGGSYVVGDNNQIDSDGVYNYTYDNEGNLVTKTNISTGDITEYTYDHRNRLIEVETRTSGSIILSTVTYVYDVFDRRIETNDNSTITRTVYSGEHVWADYNSSNAAIARYLYGDRIDQLLARWRPGQGTAWYLTDHLGTVRDIADNAGDLANTITYDSFGRVLSQTAAGWGDRFLFTGREFDFTTELYYYRARWYNPGLGRFISQDPLGFGAGDANLYRYVGNSPLGATDPSGQTTTTMYGKALRIASFGIGIGAVVCSGLEFYQAYQANDYYSMAFQAAGIFGGFALIALGVGATWPILAAGAVLGIASAGSKAYLAIDYYYKGDRLMAALTGACAGVDLAGVFTIGLQLKNLLKPPGKVPTSVPPSATPSPTPDVPDHSPLPKPTPDSPNGTGQSADGSGPAPTAHAEPGSKPSDGPGAGGGSDGEGGAGGSKPKPPEQNCFPHYTLVLTEDGHRSIGDVEAGQRVWSFDFIHGEWALCSVENRHDSTYNALLVSIELEAGTVTATDRHPFWVIAGTELDRRPVPAHLSPNENGGLSLLGRWVDSHELKEGDEIAIWGGSAIVRRITKFRTLERVCNLTVEGLHNFAVGGLGVLVHNSSGTDGDSGSSQPNVPKQIYNSIKDAPKYPKDFVPRPNGLKKVNPEQRMLDFLRQVLPGKWMKVYKDGTSGGRQVSVHYFEHQSGQVFDVKVKPGWSN